MLSLVAKSSDARGEDVWNTQTALHYLYHLGQQAVYLNPRNGNTMIEEAYMGVCKTPATFCLSSTDDHHMPIALMDKYVWALHFTYVYGDRLEMPTSSSDAFAP